MLSYKFQIVKEHGRCVALHHAPETLAGADGVKPSTPALYALTTELSKNARSQTAKTLSDSAKALRAGLLSVGSNVARALTHALNSELHA